MPKSQGPCLSILLAWLELDERAQLEQEKKVRLWVKTRELIEAGMRKVKKRVSVGGKSRGDQGYTATDQGSQDDMDVVQGWVTM